MEIQSQSLLTAPAHFDWVPLEIVDYLFSFMQIKDIQSLMLTCKYFRMVYDANPEFWKKRIRYLFGAQYLEQEIDGSWKKTCVQLDMKLMIYIEGKVERSSPFVLHLHYPKFKNQNVLVHPGCVDNNKLVKKGQRENLANNVNPSYMDKNKTAEEKHLLLADQCVQRPILLGTTLWLSDSNGQQWTAVNQCCKNCGPKILMFRNHGIDFDQFGYAKISTFARFARTHGGTQFTRAALSLHFSVNGRVIASPRQEIRCKGGGVSDQVQMPIFKPLKSQVEKKKEMLIQKRKRQESNPQPNVKFLRAPQIMQVSGQNQQQIFAFINQQYQ